MPDEPSLEQYRIAQLEQWRDRMEARVSLMEATSARVTSVFEGQLNDAREFGKAVKIALITMACSATVGIVLLIVQHFIAGGHS